MTPRKRLPQYPLAPRTGPPPTTRRNLIDPYHGFAQHTVITGETLSAIAQQFYSDASQWSRIFDANRDQILNPNLILPGQVLRIPQ